MTPTSSVAAGVAPPPGHAPPQASAVEIDALCKRYDGPLVVDDVSFVLPPGEFLTLLGPSGSGKTTTLMMIAGFEPVSSGDIRVDGRSVVDVPAQRRNLGIVFQSYALFPHMSVVDNVAFALRMRKVGRADRRRQALEMVERVGLAELADRRPRQLSGGQQQRVALARALVFEPQALLLDEPLGALDKRLRDQLQVEIKDIQRRLGVAAIFVTHDQSEAMTMSDRIAVMRDGRIEQIGTPHELYAEPATAFVATFLGETNLLRCTLDSRDGELAAVRFPDGTRGQARLGAAGAPPGACAVSLRPERARLLGAGEADEGSIEGVLTAREFLGSTHRFVVRTPHGEIAVTAADGRSVPTVTPGERVWIGFQARDARLLALDA